MRPPAPRGDRFVRRRAQERVAGEIDRVAAREPLRLQLVGAQLGGDAGVGDHRALAVGVDDGDDDAVPSRPHRPEHLHAAGADLGGDEPAGRVAAPLGDQPRLRAERSRPRGHVRGLAARAGTGDGGGVVPARERSFDPHDQVEHQVAERADDHA